MYTLPDNRAHVVGCLLVKPVKDRHNIILYKEPAHKTIALWALSR